jgi:hypothetical protein
MWKLSCGGQEPAVHCGLHAPWAAHDFLISFPACETILKKADYAAGVGKKDVMNF